MSRLRRLYLCDHYFFITCRLAGRRTLLTERDFQILAESIRSARENHGFSLTAWVFLPDHWHAILYPPYPLTLSTAMKSIKIKSTPPINDARNEDGEIWQARFYDRALRTVGEYYDCVDYIHQNPVRQGLVETAERWKWSSVHPYSSAPRATILQIDRVNLPLDRKHRL
ncbi:MAG: transposase [Acidimicrobiia bacterium]|nr:transposase [Acidimicrobiia bacterium]